MTIGLAISDLLVNATGLTALVPSGNIFAYIANEGTSLPVIVYNVDSLQSEYDKDGWVGDYCDFTIASYDSDYNNLQSIILEIRNAIELNKVDGTERFTMTSQQEGFDINENIFYNRLGFNVKIKESEVTGVGLLTESGDYIILE